MKRQERYELFARAWLKHGDVRQAALAAGYAPASALRSGRALLQRPQVRGLLQSLQQTGINGNRRPVPERDMAQDTADGAGEGRQEASASAAFSGEPTPDKVLEELAAVAFSSMTDICSWEQNTLRLKDSCGIPAVHASAVAEIAETTTSRGGTLRVKMHSKLKALDMLCRALGLFGPAGTVVGQEEAGAMRQGEAEGEGCGLPDEILARLEELYAAGGRGAAAPCGEAWQPEESGGLAAETVQGYKNG